MFRKLALPPTRGTPGWLLQLAYTTLRLFGQNGLQNHAAATAFYFLLSATPLLLLLSYALQLLGRVAENSVPATILMAALYDQMQLESLAALGFIARQTQLAASGVGLLTLVLSSRWLVNAVQGAFRIIFPSPSKRNPVVSWVLPLIILPVLFLLMCVAALAQVTLSFLAQNNFIGTATHRCCRRSIRCSSLPWCGRCCSPPTGSCRGGIRPPASPQRSRWAPA